MRPQMAYPTIASATYTFAPDKWPVTNSGKITHRKFMADGVTAGGSFVRQESLVTERVIVIEYQRLSAIYKNSFASADGTGFYYDVGGKNFEYLHTDGVTYTVRFLAPSIEISSAGDGRFNVGPIELLVTG